MKQIEDAPGDIAEQRWLQRRGPEYVQAQHLQGVTSARHCRFGFQHRTCDGDVGIACQLHVQGIGKALARPPYNDIRLADQPLGCEAELVQGAGIHEVHRCPERHPQGNGKYRHRDAQRLLAQLREQQHAPDAKPHGECSPRASSITTRSAVSAAVREWVIKIPAAEFCFNCARSRERI